jgi:hypothetical protein
MKKLMWSNKGQGLASVPGPASSTNAVNVILVSSWLIEIDDMTDLRNI